jgi:FkbM family methyltransferase
MFSAVQRVADHRITVNTVIDIGASNGKRSENGMRTFPNASFLAIEPLREREEALEALKQNHANFDYLLTVAGDKDAEEVTLVVSDDLDGSTVDGSQGGEPRIVISRTIDSIVAEKALSGPFLLKFDTHGYEVPILSGAKETLAKTSVVVMEVYNFKITEHSLRFHETCAYMEELGFRCYDIAGPLLRDYDKAFWQMDLFFYEKRLTHVCSLAIQVIAPQQNRLSRWAVHWEIFSAHLGARPKTNTQTIRNQRSKTAVALGILPTLSKQDSQPPYSFVSCASSVSFSSLMRMFR